MADHGKRASFATLSEAARLFKKSAQLLPSRHSADVTISRAVSAALFCSSAALPAFANPAHLNLPGAFAAHGQGTVGLQHHNVVNQAGISTSHSTGFKSAETGSQSAFKPLINFINSAHSSKIAFSVPQHSLGNTISLSNGVSLDLTSTSANITLGDKLVAAGNSVTIVEGRTSKTGR